MNINIGLDNILFTLHDRYKLHFSNDTGFDKTKNGS